MPRFITFVIIILVSFIGGAIGAMAVVDNPEILKPPGSAPVVASSPENDKGNVHEAINVSGDTTGLDATEKNIIGIYERLGPSVVHITAVRQFYAPFYGLVPDEGTGSGVIISQQGYILTNNHVVKDAGQVTVRFVDGDLSEATLVGVDQFTDLAVIKVDKDIDPSWAVKLGDSDKLLVGQRAIAIGNPFGFDHTLSVGIISALGRPIKTQEAEYDDMIQTDASINPGNSGGPLINSSGEVIGINTGIFSKTGTSLGIGFAIPSNSCEKVAEDLIEYGRVRRPWLGVTAFALDRSIARELGLGVSNGLLVQTVAPGSPAAKAGLKAGSDSRRLRIGFYIFDLVLGGDIILTVNDEPVLNQAHLDRQAKKMAPGDKMTLGILRNGAAMEIEAELEIEP